MGSDNAGPAPDGGSEDSYAGGVIKALRLWMGRFVKTPLHPQWLVLRHRKLVRAWVVAHARGRLVDIGCGNSPLREELPSTVEYVGLDYPLTVALGYRGGADVHCDAVSLPLASGCADVVTMLDVLEHLRNPAQAVGEAARILRVGGECLVHVPFLYPIHDAPHDYQRWTRYGLVELFQSQGFRLRDIGETTHQVESAAAILSIALAVGAIDAARDRSISCLPALALLPLIPLINMLGWTMGRFVPAGASMTFSYRAIFVKE